jgi:hypothetical protein
MPKDYDLEGAIVQIFAAAVATGFYGVMMFGLFKIAAGD